MKNVKKGIIWFFWILMMLIEWSADLISKFFIAFHESVKDLAIAIDKEYKKLMPANEPDSAKK